MKHQTNANDDAVAQLSWWGRVGGKQRLGNVNTDLLHMCIYLVQFPSVLFRLFLYYLPLVVL